MSTEKRKQKYPPLVNVRGSNFQVVKKDLNDYSYVKDIDEKVVKLAVSLAEKMAIAILREGIQPQMDKIIEEISNKLADKIALRIPSQQTIIREVTSAAIPEFKDYDFNVDLPGVNRSSGLTLKGKGASKSTSEDSIDDALDMLDNISN